MWRWLNPSSCTLQASGHRRPENLLYKNSWMLSREGLHKSYAEHTVRSRWTRHWCWLEYSLSSSGYEAAALYEARGGVSQATRGDREVERMARFAKTPHPAEHMDLEFICLENREQVDSNSDYAVRIFTDGSKIEENVGAALSLWSNSPKPNPKNWSCRPTARFTRPNYWPYVNFTFYTRCVKGNAGSPKEPPNKLWHLQRL